MDLAREGAWARVEEVWHTGEDSSRDMEEAFSEGGVLAWVLAPDFMVIIPNLSP
jgi:hypothetical protein